MTKVFYNSIIAKGLLYFSPCDLIMLFGMVFSKAKKEDVPQSVIEHERVHIRQWNEMIILSGIIILALVLIFGMSAWWMLLSFITFYVWYIIEWICKSLWYSIMIDEWTCDLETPYQSISFEREARLAEKDNNYLENSKYFSWLKFIVK
jgi:hypothetical protein